MKYKRLWEIAEADLRSNVVNFSPDKSSDKPSDKSSHKNSNKYSGQYLTAGGHHFRSLWTRDFCFSIPGLIAANLDTVADHHLNTLFEMKHPETNLIPRLLDSAPSAWRVIFNLVAYKFGARLTFPLKPNLKPEYLGEHKTPSDDSNLLFIIGCSHLEKFENNKTGTKKIETQKFDPKKLLPLYDYYRPLIRSDLINQHSFSDWQDSCRRETATSYLNVLYLAVQKILMDSNALRASDFKKTQDAVLRSFLCEKTGLLRTKINSEIFSLDSNLLAIDHGLFDERTLEGLYQKLKKSPLWSRFEIPGCASDADEAPSQVSWITKFVGLKSYHGLMHWSWLMAYSAKVAWKMKDFDEAHRILGNIEETVTRHKTVHEIYDSKSLTPFNTSLYKSESPFSWGASMILEALNAVNASEEEDV